MRSYIAELDPTTGVALPLKVNPVGSALVSMGTSLSGNRLYYGTADHRVFAYDTATSALAWTIKNGGDTQAIAATNDEVYLGGPFTNNITNKVKRTWIESVQASDGQVTAWDPKMAGGSLGVWAISTTATSLIVGGEFTSVGGVVCRRFARFPGTP